MGMEQKAPSVAAAGLVSGTRSATVAAADLHRIVSFAGQVVRRMNRIPILGMVRLAFDGERATASATDLDTELHCSRDAAGDRFEVMVDPQALMTLARFADGQVTLTLAVRASEPSILTVEADDMKAEFNQLLPATDYPAMKFTGATLSAEVGEAAFAKALAGVRPCISTEETRYYRNGAFLTNHEGKLRMVATDGHRLAIYDTDAAWGLPNEILPSGAAGILAKALSTKANGVVAIGHAKDPARMSFASGDWRMITKMIDGTFPDYTRVIPKVEEDPKFLCTLSASQIRRFPRGFGRSQGLKIDGDAGVMSFSAPDLGVFTAKLHGEARGRCGFNMRYLLDAARGGTIRIQSGNDRDPARVYTDDPALLQLLMPMRV